MQTTKATAKTGKRGKTATRQPAVPASESTVQEAQPAVSDRYTDTTPAEEQIPAVETVPAEPEDPRSEPQIRLLDLNKIVNAEYNPRKDFREETLLELAESIRQVGVLQPICVRPKGEGFEIVYGERRYWAAAMAELKFIPALVREMTDAEAEDAAITENLQREDVKPREEAAAYKRALQSGRHTIESLVGKFGKSEAYIRSRLKLCELIDTLAAQLDREEISVGVATEIAKYPVDIQQEVYEEHFAEGCYRPWKNTRIKEVARLLYERYMTKLETYRFDKTECLACTHNTANQVLFKDECTDGCAGCQNRECMVRKNNEFLIGKALELLRTDPRTTLASTDETPSEVLDALEEEGYPVEPLECHIRYYDEAPEMPEEPKTENYVSEEDFADAQKRYEAQMTDFIDKTRLLEFDISEGRVRKYAIIGSLDVDIRYETLPEEQREVTIDDESGERKVFVTVLPPSPLESLEQKDLRNRQLCYENITKDMKAALYDAKVPNKPLQKEEKQMFYYAVMKRVGSDTRLRQCGLRPKEASWMTEREQFAAAGRITAKQQAALMRAFLVDYFCSAAPESRCTDETLDTRLMCRFADLNIEKKSAEIQQKHLAEYEKRHGKVQEQIDALRAQEEEKLRNLSGCDEPDSEPQEIPDEPSEAPISEQPEETPDRSEEPEFCPLFDPDDEPDTQMPDKMRNAA